MSEAPTAFTCSDPACDIATSGKCVDGHVPPQNCPKFGREAPIEDMGGNASPRTERDKAVRLRNGRALRLPAVEQMLRSRPVRFIAIIGDSFAGKTTLITAIYDRFLRGPFAGVEFAASETLVELEMKTYYSRVESGKPHPDTPRTSRQDGLLYYHLATAKNGKRTDILFSDRAGEVYKDARNNGDEVKGLTEIPQANRVLILIDGGKLAKLPSRADAFQGARQLLRTLLDNGGLDGGAHVQVVITKTDKLGKAIDPEALKKAINDFEMRLTRDFGTRLASLTYWRIAARDPKGRLQPALGVAELIREWLQDQAEAAVRPMALAERPASEFDLLMSRTAMEV